MVAGLAALLAVLDGTWATWARDACACEGGDDRDHCGAVVAGGDARFFGTAGGSRAWGFDFRMDVDDNSGDAAGAAPVLSVGGVEASAHSQPLGHEGRQEE